MRIIQVQRGEKDMSVEVKQFDSEEAWVVARWIVERISPHCHDTQVCGGLRRGNETVHDIDIVVRPHNFFEISTIIGSNGGKSSRTKFTITLDDIPVEIYIANNEFEFEVMKLVRTGSAGFCFNIAALAHEKNMVLRYNGELFGLYAAALGWDDNARRWKYYCNPLRRLHWMEEDIIKTIFGDDTSFLDPYNRNIEGTMFGKLVMEA